MEKEIKIAAKLYECRDTAKKFYKDDYDTTLKPYIRLIEQVMSANGEDEVKALLRISKTNAYLDNGMAQMLFMTATVEMMEGNV